MSHSSHNSLHQPSAESISTATEPPFAHSKLIIFDWDGTLFDSTAMISQSLCRAASELGLGEYTKQQAQQLIGLGFAEAANGLVGRTLSDSEMQAFMARYRQYYFTAELEVSLYDGVWSLLERLRAQNRYMAVATGKSRIGLNHVFETRPELKKLFIATRTADQNVYKPHPLMLHEILSEMDVPDESAVMIGDTSYDIDMAHNAHMSSIAVTYGAHDYRHLLASKPSAVAHSVDELGRLLLG